MGIEQGVTFPITATDSFSGAFDKLKATVSDAQSSFNKLNGAMASLTPLLTIAGFAAFVEHTAQAHEEVGKLSEKLGIAVGELSAYKFGLAQNDISLESFGTGVKTLSQRLTEATNTTSKAAQVFSALGVSINGGTTPAIEKIADAFTRLPDGATKAALAVELFGKNGMQMIPFLNQGAAGIRAMKEEAARLGLVMDEQATVAAKTFNDNMKTLEASSQRLGIQLMNTLAPSLVRITGAMAEATAESGILMAAWVGLGGVAAEALRLAFGVGASDLERATSRMRDLSSEIANLKEHIAPDQRNNLLQGLVAPANMIEASFLHATQQAAGLAVYIRAIRGEFDHIEDQVSRTMGQRSLPAPGSSASRTDSSLTSRLQAILSGSTGGAAGLSEFERAFDSLQGKITATAGGLDKDFVKAVADLNIALSIGRIDLNEYAKLMDLLVRQQPAYKKGLQDEAEALKTIVDFEQQDLEIKTAESVLQNARLKQISDGNDALEHEVNLVGASNLARELDNNERQRTIALQGMWLPGMREGINFLFDQRAALLANKDAAEQTVVVWTQMADLMGDFFGNLVRDGRNAFDQLRTSLKNFAGDLVALFAKKFFLSIVAGVTGLGAVGNAAASAGAGTASGTIVNSLTMGASGTGLLGSSFLGVGSGITDFSAGLAGGGAGVFAPGSAGMFGSEIAGVIGAIPVWGQIALAIGALAAAFSLFSKGGGPKDGGYSGTSFSSSGSASGSFAAGDDNGRFFTPNGADSSLNGVVNAGGANYYSLANSLGFTPGALSLGLGFDTDPHGTAASRVSGAANLNGQQIFFDQNRDVGRVASGDMGPQLQLEVSRMVLAALQQTPAVGEAAQAIQAILSTVDAASASQDQIDGIYQLAGAFKTLSDSLAPISSSDIIGQASKGAADLFTQQGSALTDLANKSSFTVDSLQQLTGATNDYRQAAIQLVLGLETAKKSINAMFQDTSRNIQLAGLDDQGKYNFYQRDSETLLGQALGSNNADDIQRYSTQINSDINAAFALLTPEQQKEQQQAWLDRINKVNGEIAQHLTELQTQTTTTANDTLGQVKVIMDDAATKFSNSADKMGKAGDEIKAAAGEHVVVDISVKDDRVSATVNEGG